LSYRAIVLEDSVGVNSNTRAGAGILLLTLAQAIHVRRKRLACRARGLRWNLPADIVAGRDECWDSERSSKPWGDGHSGSLSRRNVLRSVDMRSAPMTKFMPNGADIRST
jgi:hypothetical protein